MAMFRSGQRVRCVRPYDPENMGIEGTFREYRFCAKGTYIPASKDYLRGDADCTVDWDAGYGSWAQTSQLEPIQPERNQVIAWRECLWQPNKTEEHA